MKKFSLLTLALAMFVSMQAQWVDDPVNNTFVASATDDAGEIYLATDPTTGNTYVQWADGGTNGWSPTLQCLNVEGVKQWGNRGIHIDGQVFNSWSQGTAIAATTDNAVVTCFAASNDRCYAIKINADGTFPWGEGGVDMGFDYATRTEILAGNDGGAWVLTYDYENTYLRYVNADGTLNDMATISFPGYEIYYSLLSPGPDGVVFVTYEKIGSGMWYVDKEIWVAGYSTDGTQVTPDVKLMNTQTFGMTYIHDVLPDGLGGGYAYIFHSGIGNVFNVYVFHFDANGQNTFSNPNGVAVHTPDSYNYYLNSNATVDPITHDIILSYIKTDAAYEQDCRLYLNRITTEGEVVWGEGILAVDQAQYEYSGNKVDAFPDGSGFMLSYMNGTNNGLVGMTLEAIGYDMEANPIWNTQMNSVMSRKYYSENNTGFNNGQNIIVWTDIDQGNLYGQNIDMNGNMGPVDQPEPCLAPEDLEGEYLYNEETLQYGALITWVAPDNMPLHYNLYRTQGINKEAVIIEIPATETSYFDEVEPSNYIYQLTAVYEHCESDFALTPDGENEVEIVVTGVNGNSANSEIEIMQIFTLNGQALRGTDLNNLSNGIYIVKGKTCDGQIVNKKVVVSNR